MDAKQLLNEVLDRFQKTETNPGDFWAFDDEHQSIGLDYTSPTRDKFWIDLNRDGVVTLLWKPAGADRPSIIRFTQRAD